METDKDTPRPISDHLGELRRRSSISFLSVALCTIAMIPAAPGIFALIAAPLRGNAEGTAVQLLALTPFEAWLVYMRIAVAAGLVASAPVWMWQAIAFFSPALAASRLRQIIALTLTAAILFIAGAAFCYFAILPAAFAWGISFTDSMGVALMPDVGQYTSMVLMLLCAFGISFELPFAVALAMRLGILTPRGVGRIRPYAIVAAFIVGAVLTPPDVISQIALSIPLILLFEAGVFIGKLIRNNQ